MAIEEKSIDINIIYDFDNLKYGIQYCYELFIWNLKHYPLNSKYIFIDNINCFEFKDDYKGSFSIFFRIDKKELTFRFQFIKENNFQEIINKKKYTELKIENFTDHFINFYLTIKHIAVLNEPKLCKKCFEPCFKLTNKQLCKYCHINELNKVDCIKCENINKNITKVKEESKFKTIVKKFKLKLKNKL